MLKTLFGQSLTARITELESLRQQVGYKTDSWRNKIATTYLQNLKKMCTVAKGGNFKLASFLQPMVFFKSPLAGQENELAGNPEFREWVKQTYNEIRPRLSELNRETPEHCYFHDASQAFFGHKEEVFLDFIHVTSAGNEHVAQHIYDKLQAQMTNNK
jgi:lysophospholipase L1-like esterase